MNLFVIGLVIFIGLIDNMNVRLRNTIILIISILLSACAAVSTQIEHGDLNVESKMSNSIFLEPVSLEKKTVFVEVKNGAAENLFDLALQIKQNLRMNGWTVVSDFNKAHDMIQINVVQFGQAKSQDDVWKSNRDGFGSVATGALAGVVVGYATGSTAWGLGVGASVAAASWVADKMVTNKIYSLITDVEISVRQNKIWSKYRTRVSSVAEKTNLKFEDAKPVLISKTAQQVGNILGDS